MDLNEYEVMVGKVDSIEKYNSYLSEAARRSGRTTALIKSLPSNGRAAIVVYRNDFGNELKRKIQDLRPDIDIRNIRIVSIYGNDLSSVETIDSLRGFGGQVFVDNAIVDIFIKDRLDQINSFFTSRAPKSSTEKTTPDISEILEYVDLFANIAKVIQEKRPVR